MKTGWTIIAVGAAAAVLLAAVGGGILRGQEAGGGKASGAGDGAAVSRARERARLLHDVYATTLEVMHRHYFRAEKAVLPARAMEDVFEDMARLAPERARWIAVNTKAMSIQHEPKTEFERKAAAVLATGKEEFEAVEDGVYRRVGAIPLGSSCVGCHTRHFSAPTKTPRFAGLVISVPLGGR